MVIELVGMVAPMEMREQLGSALSSFLGPTQVEPGCLSCVVYQDWSDPTVLYMESRWESMNHLIRHVRSEGYKKLLGLMELGAEPPTIEFLTVSEARGLDFIESVRQGKKV